MSQKIATTRPDTPADTKPGTKPETAPESPPADPSTRNGAVPDTLPDTPPETSPEISPTPPPDLDGLRDLWRRGAWSALAAHEDADLDTCPGGETDRGGMALMIGAGLAQAGDLDGARRMLDRARSWGRTEGDIARILISGAYSGLGTTASLLRDEALADSLFQTAARLGEYTADPARLGRLRGLGERIRTEQFPEAIDLVDREFKALTETGAINPSRAEMLRSEIELLNVEFSIALQRRTFAEAAGQRKDSDTARDTAGDLASRATSQLGQELWVLERTGHKRGGFFVEFGATDGVRLSNSYLLETGFDWTGLLAEPNPEFFAQLQRNRSCTVTSECIMGETGKTVEFVLADAYGGAIDYAADDMHLAKRQAYMDEGKVISLTSISLNDFLEKHDAPAGIDYMSIDTEGSELEILTSFDFDRWQVGLFTIEHNFSAQRGPIRDLMHANGYDVIEKSFDDWFFRVEQA